MKNFPSFLVFTLLAGGSAAAAAESLPPAFTCQTSRVARGHGPVAESLTMTPSLDATVQLGKNETLFVLTGQLAYLSNGGFRAHGVHQDDQGVKFADAEAYEIEPMRYICQTAADHPQLLRCDSLLDSRFVLRGANDQVEHALQNYNHNSDVQHSLDVTETITRQLNPEVVETDTFSFNIYFAARNGSGQLQGIARNAIFKASDCTVQK